MIVLETERLVLRRLARSDAAFMLALLNDPAWLRFIGDRGVRTPEQAADYIEKGPMASYAAHGFGLYLVERRDGGEAIGICGLVKRDFLEDADLGFALLPAYRRAGYAREAAEAVLEHAEELGLRRLAAITNPDNEASAGLLEKLGFRFERMVKYPGEEREIRLFAMILR